MAAELASNVARARLMRVDVIDPVENRLGRAAVPIVVALLAGFVVISASGLDLGGDEARLGLAAGARVGPMGLVYGGWEPSLWPLQVVPSRIWAMIEGGSPSPGVVRWPSAIAATAIGLILARRAANSLGSRGAILVSACLFGSLAMIDRTSSVGIDWISALAVIAALDRLLSAGPGWLMGLYAALAFLAGGLPPLVMTLLPVVVLKKSGKLTGLIVPPILAAVSWSIWTLAVAPAQAWGAALTLPLVQESAWMLGPGVLAIALPWTPVAFLWAFPSARLGAGRGLVFCWLQVAAVALIAGTVIPGVAASARLPIGIGVALAAASVLDRAWSGGLSRAARRTLFGVVLLSTVLWAALMVPSACYIAASIAAYRTIGVILAVASVVTVVGTIAAVRRGDVKGSIFALVAVAVMIKMAHAGIYAPEWNYRFSQGPWGRAIRQWVPPKWTLYSTVAWPPDLAFAIGRPIRRLSGPERLEDELGRHPQLVLLHDSDFENWPTWAPKLIKLREFQDQYGGVRVLARTEGDFNLLRIGPGD